MEQSIFLDKERKQHGRKRCSLAFQELLGFLCHHLDEGHDAHPPLAPEARPLTAKTEIPRPAAFLPGLTSVQKVCEAAKSPTGFTDPWVGEKYSCLVLMQCLGVPSADLEGVWNYYNVCSNSGQRLCLNQKQNFFQKKINEE